jgi:glycerol kinase
MTVLAIDQGTSGTKALVVDGTSVLAVAELPVRPR